MLFAVVRRGAKLVLMQWRPLYSVEIPCARNHFRQNLPNVLILVLCEREVTNAGVLFLCAFTELQKATISFVIFVCLSVFVKFYITVFFENLSRKLRFHYNLTRKTGNLCEDRYTFSSS
jgi:hypothetical protein